MCLILHHLNITLGQLKSEWSAAVVWHAAVSKREHSKGLLLARVILGQLTQCEELLRSLTSLLSPPYSQGKEFYLFLPEYPFFLYLPPLQMISFGWKEKGAMGQPSTLCPGPPHSFHRFVACFLTLFLSMAFILSSAVLCRTKYSSTWSNTKFGSAVTITSTWRFVFMPKWPCWQVTCHLLQSPSQRKVSLYCLQASVPFGEMRCLPRTTWFSCRCGPPLALSSRPSLQTKPEA